MKVSCTQEALARGLSIVGRAVAVRSPNPITSNVLIGTDGGQIKLVATDAQSLTISCWIGGQIEEEGAITVPARLLTDFVNTLPNDKIVMSVAARSRQMRLACARNEATIGGIDAEDFPPPPTVKDGVSVALKPKELRQAIAQTVFAAATDDSRPTLGAYKVIFLTDVEGWLADPADPTSLVSEADVAHVRRELAQGAVGGGMLPKLKACADAVESGVPLRSHRRRAQAALAAAGRSSPTPASARRCAREDAAGRRAAGARRGARDAHLRPPAGGVRARRGSVRL